MKIAIVTQPFNIGGAQAMVRNLVEYLTEHEVCLICIGNRVDNQMTTEAEGFCSKVFYINGNHLQRYLALSKILRKFKPDVVHSHLSGNQYSCLWSLLHRKNIVSTMHTVPKNAYVRSCKKIAYKLLKKNRMVSVAVSEENLVLAKDYYGYTDDRLVYINNGVDLNKYYKKSHESFTFVNVATQDSNKNQALILKAFKRFLCFDAEAKLILVGAGSRHEQLKTLAREINIENSVLFAGRTSPVEYLAVSDVYIQSSHVEGLPLAVLEGMAAGLPVISTDVGGMKDIVKDNGILIKDADEDGLFNAMIKIASDKSLRQEMSRQSLEIVKKYSSKEMAKKYIEVYKKRKID